MLRKKLHRVLGALTILLSVSLIPLAPASSNTSVHIPDANLRALIAEHLGVPASSTITTNQMLTLRELVGYATGITNLTGLEAARNLADLELTYSSISSLEPLRGLPKLVYLNVAGNSITDISVAATLPALTDLDFPDNSVTNLAPLRNLSNLKHLDVSNNGIADLSPIATLTNLEMFFANNNYITDATPLAGLTKVHKFEVLNQELTLPQTQVGTTQTLHIKRPNGTAVPLILAQGAATISGTNITWTAAGASKVSWFFQGNIAQATLQYSGHATTTVTPLPGEPEPPTTPENPGLPNTPEVPVTPDVPGTPVVPVAPENPVGLPAAGYAQIVPSPDLTGDGFGDVLSVDDDGILWVHAGSATGKLSKPTKLGSGWGGLTISAPGDFNQDGKADILAKDAKGDLFFYPGNGKGGLGKSTKAGPTLIFTLQGI